MDRARSRPDNAPKIRIVEAEMEPVGQLGWIQIDCRDPVSLAAFWGAVLGFQIDRNYLGDPPHYVGLVATNPDHPQVNFQRVPEPKIAKNRLHFDLRVDDVEQATAQIEALGGLRLEMEDVHEYGYNWRVMADPEGNEFCLIFEMAAAS
jgi:predicted enzyme related to lactoylglutathione lyase